MCIVRFFALAVTANRPKTNLPQRYNGSFRGFSAIRLSVITSYLYEVAVNPN